jgi:hypothetical protein
LRNLRCPESDLCGEKSRLSVNAAFNGKREFRMWSPSGVARLATVVFYVFLGACALANAATGGYHLVKKFSFEAAQARPARRLVSCDT